MSALVKPRKARALARRPRRGKPVATATARAGLPAQPPGLRYGDFDQWVTLGDTLAGYHHELLEILELLENREEPTPATWFGWQEIKRWKTLLADAEALLERRVAAGLADAVAEFVEARAYFEHDARYEDADRRFVDRDFISERVAMLLGAFPSGAPPSPDVYATRMIEEIIALEPSAAELEAATRTLVREKRFLPSIAEVLEALRDARTPAGEDFWVVDENEPMVCWAHRALTRAVAEAKAGPPARIPPARARLRLVPAAGEEDGT